MRRIALAGAAALALSFHAVAQAATDRGLLDCTRLPAEAATDLPPPVAGWARIVCRPFGQMFVAQQGWTWRYSGTFMQEVVVAAIMGSAAEEGAGARYFRDVSVTERDQQAALEMDRQFKQDIVSYAFIAGDETPRMAYTVRAVTDVLDIITVHFMERKEGGLWGVACTPDCRPEHVFIVQKTGG
jgi:hypothetical protein